MPHVIPSSPALCNELEGPMEANVCTALAFGADLWQNQRGPSMSISPLANVFLARRSGSPAIAISSLSEGKMSRSRDLWCHMLRGLQRNLAQSSWVGLVIKRTNTSFNTISCYAYPQIPQKGDAPLDCRALESAIGLVWEVGPRHSSDPVQCPTEHIVTGVVQQVSRQRAAYFGCLTEDILDQSIV